MDIIDRIEVIKNDLGLSLSEMSKQMGYAHNQMFRLLHHEIQQTPSFIDKFCKTFNVNYDYLVDGKGKKFLVKPKLYKKKEIKKRLKELRNEEDITLYSTRVGIYPSNYKKIESGETKLTEKSAERIAEANDISIDWLMYGDELSKDYPINKEMIEFLKRNPEQRKKIRKLMKKENMK